MVEAGEFGQEIETGARENRGIGWVTTMMVNNVCLSAPSPGARAGSAGAGSRDRYGRRLGSAPGSVGKGQGIPPRQGVDDYSGAGLS